MHLSLDLTKQIEMWSEAKRLATFRSWPFSSKDPCSAERMAAAGFYYIGTDEEPDCVKCFVCSKALDGWDRSDDPWFEHKSHSKTCSFAKLGLPEDSLTCSQLIAFACQLFQAITKSHTDTLRKQIPDNRAIKAEMLKLKNIQQMIKKRNQQ